MNLVILKGNLTRAPELTFTPAQVPVCDFGLAVNKKWTGQDGQKREEVCFVDCRAFKKTAETINQYIQKGNPILIQGELHFSSWEDKNGGGKRSKLRVTVNRFEFINGQEQGQQAPQQAPQQQYQNPVPQQSMDNGSDLPF